MTQILADYKVEKLINDEIKTFHHRILIIDDDENLVLSIKEKLYNLEEYSFTVETANDPLAALELIKSMKQKGISISLIISDLSMPGMEGNVLLRGSASYKVLIDGKPQVISGSDLLKQIPASTIDRIEVITNPSAKYDPEGASGIINILTKKLNKEGISGMINASAGSSGRKSGDYLLTFSKNKWKFFTYLPMVNKLGSCFLWK